MKAQTKRGIYKLQGHYTADPAPEKLVAIPEEITAVARRINGIATPELSEFEKQVRERRIASKGNDAENLPKSCHNTYPGRDMIMKDVTYGGDIATGADGKAFLPERLKITGGRSFLVIEATVFKTAEEARAVGGTLDAVTENRSSEKLMLKKSIRLDGCLTNICSRKRRKYHRHAVGRFQTAA
jgi:hypothetical protein